MRDGLGVGVVVKAGSVCLVVLSPLCFPDPEPAARLQKERGHGLSRRYVLRGRLVGQCSEDAASRRVSLEAHGDPQRLDGQDE